MWNAVAGLGLALLLTACGTPRDFSIYQETIADFQTATDRTAAVTLEYVQSINAFERDYELERLRDDPERPLDVSKLSNPILSPTAVAARNQAFSVLKQYTQMLASLADSDASERFRAASARAKAAADTLLADLSTHSEVLSGLPLAEATTPLQTIADAIATEIINAKRAAALDAAVTKAAPAIQEISGTLREDLRFVIRQRDSVKQLEIAELSIAYAQAQAGGNNAARLKTLSELDKALQARSRELATLQGLLQTLDQFDAAHDALVDYARSDKGPQDLNDLIAVVRSYAATAEQIFESFQKAKEALS
jgi:hypothetical protein